MGWPRSSRVVTMKSPLASAEGRAVGVLVCGRGREGRSGGRRSWHESVERAAGLRRGRGRRHVGPRAAPRAAYRTCPPKILRRPSSSDAPPPGFRAPSWDRFPAEAVAPSRTIAAAATTSCAGSRGPSGTGWRARRAPTRASTRAWSRSSTRSSRPTAGAGRDEPVCGPRPRRRGRGRRRWGWRCARRWPRSATLAGVGDGSSLLGDKTRVPRRCSRASRPWERGRPSSSTAVRDVARIEFAQACGCARP